MEDAAEVAAEKAADKGRAAVRSNMEGWDRESHVPVDDALKKVFFYWVCRRF